MSKSCYWKNPEITRSLRDYYLNTQKARAGHQGLREGVQGVHRTRARA